MNLAENIGRFFQTDAFVRRESARWAHANFPGPREAAARATTYALVSTLGVSFEQLMPMTDIVRELGADEWTEWAEIQMSLEEELKCYFPAKPDFVGRTIAALVDFVAALQGGSSVPKPRRGFSKSDWCLAACLGAQ